MDYEQRKLWCFRTIISALNLYIIIFHKVKYHENHALKLNTAISDIENGIYIENNEYDTYSTHPMVKTVNYNSKSINWLLQNKQAYMPVFLI